MSFTITDDNYLEKTWESFAKQQFMDFIGARLVEVIFMAGLSAILIINQVRYIQIGM